MKVFLTGVAGFLGSHLAERYVERGDEVVGIDNMLGGDAANVVPGVTFREADCNDPGAYRDLLAGCDLVFHCAAAPYEGLSVFSPRLVYEHTLMSTVSVLSAAIAAGPRRVVFCSSMARYGDQPPPFDESLEPRPVDPYGWAKHSAETAVRGLCDIHGVEWAIAVPHNIYGPRQRYVDPYRNVVSIMVNRILQGRPPIVYGDGSQRRSFSYVDDVVGPLMQLGGSPGARGEVFNIGPDDDGITVLELARLLLRLLDSDLEPEFFPSRPYEVHSATCSAAKARRLLGYRPTWSLEKGLLEQIAWIRELGPRPFEYHLPVELPSARTPRTWTERLM